MIIGRIKTSCRLLSTGFCRIRISRKFVKVASGSVAVLVAGGSAFWYDVKQFHSSLEINGGSVEDYKRQQQLQLFSLDDEHDDFSQLSVNVIANVSAWIDAHSNNLRKLIALTKSDNPTVRNIVVKALAEKKDWSDAAFETFSKLCDYKAVIGLARTKAADSRLLKKPPILEPCEDLLEDQFRNLLSELPVHDLDQCTRYFTSNALAEGKTPSEESDMIWSFDGNGHAWSKTSRMLPSDFRDELFCLHALFTHSKILSHCPDIVKLGGLTLLQRICENRQHSIKVMRNAARIMANLSVCPQLHSAIINSGWVSTLREWLSSSDVALSLNASKALANMDRDFEAYKYHDGVYFYHPLHRSSEQVLVDVVFVHGLLGGPFYTWRQKGPKPVDTKTSQVKSLPQQAKALMPSVKAKPHSTGTPSQTFCWPKDWLAKDLPNVRILTVEYDTHLSEWAPKCPYESDQRSLAVRSKDMLTNLRRAGLGNRPIIWVGHSMGGLLIKKMLTVAAEDPSLSDIVEKTHGAVFYSVPHRGSALAGYSAQSRYLLFPSIEVTELAPGSEMLRKLHSKFSSIVFEREIPILSFGEGKKTELPFNIKQVLVTPDSSNPGFGVFHLMNDFDHLTICKPQDNYCPLYTRTLEFMLNCLPHKLMQQTLHAQGMEDFMLEVLW